MPISHRLKLRLLTSALAVVATAASAFISTPAGASTLPPDAPPSITDPLGLIGRLAPGILAETSIPPTPAEAAAVEAETGVAPFRADLPTDPAHPLLLSPAETEGAGLPVAVTIDGARGQARLEQGITAFADPGASSAAYLQPVQNGVRMLTALADATAGEDFSYTFDVPAGTYSTALPGGDTILSDASHHYIGSLGEAWAVDARGRALPTSYSWSGSTLTQHVELSADTAYPVLIDPTWYYTYDFSATLPGYHATYPKATDTAVDRLLHTCFNCYFPINGAPRSYPFDGQVLLLNASPFSLELTAAPVLMQTANQGAMQFVAQAGHFDGAGSMITFSWYNDPSGYIHLYVHAKILRDLGVFLNVQNSHIAGANWLLYWQRVADHASGSSGGGGV
ncbi:hypothetical protein [Herbiconiux ginsengi]|uniref:Uncharacterized protein n=1 Tax=Herbiconiux ginsengi TaxID=381665 RepID=A0A1H3QM52_9MICO|nr:hypothetical protein [Herbiconiux ginsengi]SDZ14390.1 hypothetical protein SAMN05216554_2619 [Herbiconiux ginsengi]